MRVHARAALRISRGGLPTGGPSTRLEVLPVSDAHTKTHDMGAKESARIIRIVLA